MLMPSFPFMHWWFSVWYWKCNMLASNDVLLKCKDFPISLRYPEFKVFWNSLTLERTNGQTFIVNKPMPSQVISLKRVIGKVTAFLCLAPARQNQSQWFVSMRTRWPLSFQVLVKGVRMLGHRLLNLFNWTLSTCWVRRMHREPALEGKTASCDAVIPCGRPGRGSWLWIRSFLTIVAIWRVNQQMKNLFLLFLFLCNADFQTNK